MELTIDGLERDIGIKELKEGYKILIRGDPGSLKSTLAFYLVWNVCNPENKAIYLLFEEDEFIFLNHLESMGIHPRKKMDNNSLLLLPVPIFPTEEGKKIADDILAPQEFINQLNSFLNKLEEIGEKEKYKMVVFDTLSTIKDFYQADSIKDIRINLQKLFKHPSLKKVISFFITEKTKDSVFNVEDYLVDGIIDMRFYAQRPSDVLFQCKKMRGYKINRVPHVVKFDSGTKYKFKLGETVPVYTKE